MTENEFKEFLSSINVNLTEKQFLELNKYYEMLISANQNINLTGITEKKDVYLKHFYDSLTLNSIVDLSKINTFCDIGTGAGFPGLVVKIAFPNIKVTLLDSLTKRTEFLKSVIKELNLQDIEVINVRAEEYKNREFFDLVTARAVAQANILLELAAPLAKDKIVLMKGNINDELKNSKHFESELGIKLLAKKEFFLPIENSKRTLICYEKIAKTPLKYPRRYDQIKKRPL